LITQRFARTPAGASVSLNWHSRPPIEFNCLPQPAK
jgi:hypothetical protein